MANRLTPEQEQAAAQMAENITCALSKEDVLKLICAEWIYWYDTDFEERPELNDASIFAVGALSNIIGRIAMGGRDFNKTGTVLEPQFAALRSFIEKTGQGSVSGEEALAALELIQKG